MREREGEIGERERGCGEKRGEGEREKKGGKRKMERLLYRELKIDRQRESERETHTHG